MKNITTYRPYGLLLLLLSLLLGTSAELWGQTFTQNAPTGQSLKYTVASGSNVQVERGANNLTGALEIPGTVTNNAQTYTVTGIVPSAFSGCNGLTAVTIPNSVTFIGEDAFEGCTGLRKVNYTGSVGEWCHISFNNNKANPLSAAHHLYLNDVEVTSLQIPNSISSLGNYLFYGCQGITSITIPASVSAIWNYTFCGCTGVGVVNVPASVTSIGNCAFSGIGAVKYCGIATGAPWGAIGSGCSVLVDGDFIFSDNTKTRLLRYIGAGGEVAIPASVTAIGDSAFSRCASVTAVTMGNAVTYIGDSAFAECTALTSATIGNAVTYLGKSAYRDCRSLSSVTIGNAVDAIREDAFRGCSSITTVDIPNSATFIGKNAFYNCSRLASATLGSAIGTIGNYAFYQCSALTSIVIPDATTSVGEYAFYKCTALTRATLGNGVSTIGTNAFASCSAMTQVTLGSGVTAIQGSAFSDCGSLSRLYYNGSLEQWCGIAFSTSQSNPLSKANYFFVNNTEVRDLVIPNTVTTLKAYAFFGGRRFTSVSVPNSVTKIYSEVFSGCSGLDSIVIPSSVTSIGTNAFNGIRVVRYCGAYSTGKPWGAVYAGCNYVVEGDFVYACHTKAHLVCYLGSGGNITIPATVDTIGERSFQGCTGLSSVTIPDNVSRIESNAFASCNSLSNITFGGGVRFVGTNAFSSCSNLQKVNCTGTVGQWCQIYFSGEKSNPISFTNKLYVNDVLVTDLAIPDEVTSIGPYAFYKCTALTSISGGNNVTTIGSNAFSGCTHLTSASIGNAVTRIGDKAFNLCSGLVGLTVPETVSRIDADAFFGISAVIYCGSATGSPWGAGFVGCNVYVEDDFIYLDNTKRQLVGYIGAGGDIAIPNTVRIIGASAFQNCSTITAVTIPVTVDSIGRYAFSACSALRKVNYLGSVAEWCRIAFANGTANPLNTGNVLYLNDQQVSNLVIPDTVSAIGRFAFYCCTLNSIDLGNGVVSIGDSAFMDCRKPTSLVIPNSVGYIGRDAFRNCQGLTSVRIGNSVRTIHAGAFNGCTHLTKVYSSGSVTQWCQIRFGNSNANPLCYAHNLYFNDTLLHVLAIPDSVTKIEAYAFYSCSCITSLSLSSYLDTINGYAFASCTGIPYLFIPNSVVSIGSYAFNKCTRLSSVRIGNSVRLMGNSAFEGCTALSFVNILNSLTSLNDRTFYGCTRLNTVVLPRSMATIRESVFRGCNNDLTVYIGRQTPPSLSISNNRSFDTNYRHTIHVPCNNILSNYQSSTHWNLPCFSFVEDCGVIQRVLDDTVIACAPYMWRGHLYPNSGTYTDTLFNAIPGVYDSIYVLHLTMSEDSSYRDAAAACDSFLWARAGAYYATTGVHAFLGTTAMGCRSFDTLDLSVLNTGRSLDTRIAADSFLWRGTTFYASGSYADTVRNAVGGRCDSIYGLNLTVAVVEMRYDTLKVCDSCSWRGRSFLYSGEYSDTVFNAITGFCDTIHFLHLTVNSSTHRLCDTTACGSFRWLGVGLDSVLTASGLYGWAYLNGDGCPSTDSLHILVGNGSFATLDTAVCDSFFWSGGLSVYGPDTLLRSSGAFTGPAYNNAFGCPSRDTLRLTVYQTALLPVESVSVCGSLTWRGTRYSTSGLRCDTVPGAVQGRCDSIYRLDLACYDTAWQVSVRSVASACNWRGTTYNASGDYTDTVRNAVGGVCDSIYILKLLVRGVAGVDDTLSACDSLVWRGRWYRTSGIFYDSVMEVATGFLDSLFSLNLTIGVSTNTVYDTTVCDSLRWLPSGSLGHGDNSTHRASGIFYGPAYTNGMGCPGADRLRLTVFSDSMAAADTLRACDSFSWRGYSLTASGLYRDTVRRAVHGHCDSVYAILLSVGHPVFWYDTVHGCDSFYWNANGLTYLANGDYQRIIPGTLPGACDTTRRLHLTMSSSSHTATAQTVCHHHLWHNTSYGTSGVYTYDYLNDANCLSTDTLHLTVYVDGQAPAENQAVCGSYRWRGREYAETGFFFDTVRAAVHGLCDSIYFLALTQHEVGRSVSIAEAVNVYRWRNRTLTASGIYGDTVHNAVGGMCDSIYVLKLTVSGTIVRESRMTACDSFAWRGHTYRYTGFYDDSVFNLGYCDTLYKLRLTIYNGTHRVKDTAVCERFIWYRDGNAYTASRGFKYEYLNEEGCPSTDSLHVQVNHGSSMRYTETACDSFRWDRSGMNYTTSGRYRYDYLNDFGCPSRDTLFLTVKRSWHRVFSTLVCDSFYWRGNGNIGRGSEQYYYATGSYLGPQYTNSEGCFSQDMLQLEVRSASSGEAYVAGCTPFVWDGRTIYTSNTYTATLPHANQYGCDSTVHLHFTALPSTTGEFAYTACDSLNWYGRTYYTSGTYSHHFYNANQFGCDSIVYIHLTMNWNSYANVAETACDSFYSPRFGKRFHSGNYYDTIPNATGCDSITTLHLTLYNTTFAAAEVVTHCGSYAWRGQQCSTSGTYSEVMRNAVGGVCDSVLFLRLTVAAPAYTMTSRAVCDSFVWRGRRFDSSDYYLDTVRGAVAGVCDSVYSLNLTVYHGSGSRLDTAVCDRFRWQGSDFAQSGDYSYAYSDSHGCSATDRLHLTVHHTSYDTLFELAPYYYNWMGLTFTSSGDYTRVFHDSYGCDSIVTLRLVTFQFPRPKLLSYKGRLIVVHHHPNGEEQTFDYGNYTWYHSSDSLGVYQYDASNQGSDFYAHIVDNEYTTLSGCFFVRVPSDSTEQYWITSDTLCLAATAAAVMSQVTLFPNPMTSGATLSVALENISEGSMLSVYDVYGRELFSQTVSSDRMTLPCRFTAGVYTLRVAPASEGEEVPFSSPIVRRFVVR